MPAKKKIARSTRKSALRTAGALTAKKAHEAKPTPVQLLASPKPILAWLHGQAPNAIAARDILSNTRCLAATFLSANGYPENTFRDDLYNLMPVGGWLGRAINTLATDRPITAREAIAALDKAGA